VSIFLGGIRCYQEVEVKIFTLLSAEENATRSVLFYKGAIFFYLI